MQRVAFSPLTCSLLPPLRLCMLVQDIEMAAAMDVYAQQLGVQ